MGLLILSEAPDLANPWIYLALAVGGVLVWILLRARSNSHFATRQREADRVVEDARSRAEQVVRSGEVEAKAHFLKMQQEFDSRSQAIRDEQRETEKKLEKRSDTLDRKFETLSSKERTLELGEQRQAESERTIQARLKEVTELQAQQRAQLLKINNLSHDEAKRMLFASLEQELEQECAELIDRRITEANESAEQKCRDITLTAIQRYAASHAADSTVSTVAIPSDEMKGRVIGREGRNIRAFEKATGVDVIVDDTPGVVVISCFDPVRKEIARQSLEKLVQDGRIHPARIEELVDKTRQTVEKQVTDLGRKASMEAKVPALNKQLIELLGRMAYRTSYGQNVLQHSIEVGYLCQVMADELGLDGALARRCGLLHDIGKAVAHDEAEGGHPVIGAEICLKCGEPPEVVNACAAHHGDVASSSPYTPLVMAADAISAARPGSRREESFEKYIKRMQEMEGIATSVPGVDQAYAIQAGREVRVIVNANRIDDSGAVRVARQIADTIQQRITYPGEIRVTVLRETRAVEIAR